MDLDITEPIENRAEIKKVITEAAKKRQQNLSEIETRYRRLSNGHRRPSFEYLKVDEIREIFSAYHPEIDSMKDDDVIEFYEKWAYKHEDEVKMAFKVKS